MTDPSCFSYLMMQWEGINYCKPKKTVFESSGKCLNINVCKETLGGLVDSGSELVCLG